MQGNATAIVGKNRLAGKLTLIIMSLSLFLIVIISSVELYFVHKHELNEIKQVMAYIHGSHLAGIIEEVWIADDEKVKSYLGRFLNLGAIEYLEIRRNGHALWSVGILPGDILIERSYPLIKWYNDKPLNLGQLHIIAGSSKLNKTMLEKFAVVVMVNSMMIIIVALILLWLIRTLITRHLFTMANYARSLDIDAGEISTLSLLRKAAHEDELDDVVKAVNQLVTRLGLSLLTARKSEQRTRLILNATSDGIYGLDAQGCATFINHAALNMLGYAKGELLHVNNHKLIHHQKANGEPYPEAECKMLTPFKTGQAITVTDELLWRKNGESFEVEYTSVPIKHKNIVNEVIVTFTDDSEQRRLDKLLYTISKGVSGDFGSQFLTSLVKNLSVSLNCDFAFIGIHDPVENKIDTVVHFSHGTIRQNFSYSLAGTPCSDVMSQGLCLHSEKVAQKYPDDLLLSELGIESYAAVPLKNAKGQALGLLVILHKQPLENPQQVLHLLEIFGSRAAAELQRLNDEESLNLAAIAFETHEAIAITDANGVVLQVNISFTETTGYDSENIIGKPMKTLKSGRHDKLFYEQMWDSIHRDGYWEGEIWNRRKDGGIYPVWQTITAVKDSNGSTKNYVSAFHDIGEQKRAQKQIYQLENYDRLTNLPNRNHMMNLIEQAISTARADKHYGGIIIFDINDLRAINDSLGHHLGDEVLKIIAAKLRAAVDKTCNTGRLGGDEFIILLPVLDKDMSKARQQSLNIVSAAMHSLDNSIHVGKHSLAITACLGYSLFPFAQQTADTLLMQADTALHKAKENGPNCVQIFKPEMHKIVERRLQIKNDMRHALGNKEFSIYLQPQFDNNKNLIGAEALIRWIHPQQGIISPLDFIPLAEETGQIIDIGNWVLQQSCAILQQKDCNLKVLAVNVSPVQFHQPEFVDNVKRIIKESGVDPSRLELEITESVVISNLADIRDKMLALRKIGIKFAIDDFGTGYSSLAYLSKLPISKIKIDQSFVMDLDKTGNNTAIIESILSIASNMNFSVIAEGVETEAAFNLLREKGCDYYQGYLFSKPLNLEQFRKVFYQKDC